MCESFPLPLTVGQFPPRQSFVLCSPVQFSLHQFLPVLPALHWSVLYLVLCFIICYWICPCLLLFCSLDYSFALFKLVFCFCLSVFGFFAKLKTLKMDETGPEEKRFHSTSCQTVHLTTFSSYVTCLNSEDCGPDFFASSSHFGRSVWQ